MALSFRLTSSFETIAVISTCRRFSHGPETSNPRSCAQYLVLIDLMAFT
jgi:hypothetical protein